MASALTGDRGALSQAVRPGARGVAAAELCDEGGGGAEHLSVETRGGGARRGRQLESGSEGLQGDCSRRRRASRRGRRGDVGWSAEEEEAGRAECSGSAGTSGWRCQDAGGRAGLDVSSWRTAGRPPRQAGEQPRHVGPQRAGCALPRVQLCHDLLRLGEEDEAWKLANEIRNADGYNAAAHNIGLLEDEMRAFVTIQDKDFLLRMPKRDQLIYADRALQILRLVA